LAWHFGEASVEEMREKLSARSVNDWLAYGKAIGGLTPLSAEIVVFAIWQVAMHFGCKLRFDEIFLPEVGRHKSAEEVGATLDKWVGFCKGVKSGSNDPRPRDQD
jgi:hypothetical protein